MMIKTPLHGHHHAHHKRHEQQFYGSTTVGEKGQIVIPAEAREALNLEKGDKLLAFGNGDMLVFTKLSQVEKLASHFSKKLEQLRKVLKQAEQHKS